MSNRNRRPSLPFQQVFRDQSLVFRRKRFGRSRCVYQRFRLCKAQTPDEFGFADFIRHVPDQLL